MTASFPNQEVTPLTELEVAQLRQVLHKMADFIALFEASEEKLVAREQALETKLSQSERIIHEQLTNIRGTLRDFQEIMSETGAARWRIAAESALKEGKEHLKTIQQTCADFNSLTKDTCERLDRAASYTVKNITHVVSSFSAEDFRRMTTDNSNQVMHTCTSAIKKINSVIAWFSLRNAALVFSITLVVSIVIGLYLDDEWPWESHSKIVEQRTLAQAVINSWSHLSQDDQQRILQDAQG